MESLAHFDELYVVSDLHMGADQRFQLFKETTLLARVIESLGSRRQDHQIGLCINGDIVDFLADNSAKCFDPSGAKQKLVSIIGGECAEVWLAFRAFLKKKNHTLIVTLGNHDTELALPWVREEFLNQLTDGDKALRGRIQLAFDGAGFACQVGRANVLCVHGNDVDNWNCTDYERLRRIGRDLLAGLHVDEWVPNAGSQLVVSVMNVLKQKYPFIDLLKPEVEAVIPILVTLSHDDPQFGNMTSTIAKILGVARRLAWDTTRRAWGMLSAEELDTTEPRLQRECERRLVELLRHQLLDGNDHDLRIAAGESSQGYVEQQLRKGSLPLELLGGYDAQELGGRSDYFRQWFGKDRIELLRKSLARLIRDQSFDRFTPDTTFRELDAQTNSRIHFLIAGHTHLERALKRRTSQTYYYNSGTWVHLMKLSPKALASTSQFNDMYEAIRSGDRAALQPFLLRRPAVVRIVAEPRRVVGDLLRPNRRATGELLSRIRRTHFVVE
jgi:UDP-2,3-diacylglucosamine pyrophosphatase LpxH